MISPNPPRDPLPIETVANRFVAQIQPWAKERGGTVESVQNLAHLWEKIYDLTLKDCPRIYICWNGETAMGGDDESNTLCRNENDWICVIIRGHGFKNLLFDGQGSDQTQKSSIEPFTTSIEQVRNLIRLTKNVTELPPVTFKMTEPLPNLGPSQIANIFLDGFAIHFSTANDIIQIRAGT